MNITTVEKIEEIQTDDTVLVINGDDIKQVPRKKIAEAEVKELKEVVDDLKKSGRDGREDLAAAITEKGVETAVEDNMHVMAANVRKIPSGSICGIVVDTSPYTHPYGAVSNLCGIIFTEQEANE